MYVGIVTSVVVLYWCVWSTSAGSRVAELVATEGDQAPGVGGHQRLPGHRGGHCPRDRAGRQHVSWLHCIYIPDPLSEN